LTGSLRRRGMGRDWVFQLDVFLIRAPRWLVVFLRDGPGRTWTGWLRNTDWIGCVTQTGLSVQHRQDCLCYCRYGSRSRKRAMSCSFA
jgi:hypothetical protein